MSQQASNSQTLTVALLTVGLDHELTDKIVSAASEHHWTVTHDDFDEYVSAVRRPAVSAETKAADLVIAIIDFDRDPAGAAETATYLQQLFFGRFFAAALSGRNDPDLLLSAMRAGCNEVLKNPLDPRQLADTFDRQERQWATNTGRARNTGHIISFFGAKGGVGTTTVAVTLAYYLVRQKNKRVLLIDNHPEFGHVCLYLGLDGSRYHFDELIRNVNRLDSTLLRGFIAKHGSADSKSSRPPSRTTSPVPSIPTLSNVPLSSCAASTTTSFSTAKPPSRKSRWPSWTAPTRSTWSLRRTSAPFATFPATSMASAATSPPPRACTSSSTVTLPTAPSPSSRSKKPFASRWKSASATPTPNASAPSTSASRSVPTKRSEYLRQFTRWTSMLTGRGSGGQSPAGPQRLLFVWPEKD